MHKYDLRTDAQSLIGAFLPRFTKLTVDIYECPTASIIMSATHLEIFKPFNSEGTFDLSLQDLIKSTTYFNSFAPVEVDTATFKDGRFWSPDNTNFEHSNVGCDSKNRCEGNQMLQLLTNRVDLISQEVEQVNNIKLTFKRDNCTENFVKIPVKSMIFECPKVSQNLESDTYKLSMALALATYKTTTYRMHAQDLFSSLGLNNPNAPFKLDSYTAHGVQLEVRDKTSNVVLLGANGDGLVSFTNNPSGEWVYCAKQNEYCTCPSKMIFAVTTASSVNDVAQGQPDLNQNYSSELGPLEGKGRQCLVSAFGDPVVGELKTCFCKSYAYVSINLLASSKVNTTTEYLLKASFVPEVVETNHNNNTEFSPSKCSWKKCANARSKCACQTDIKYGRQVNGYIDYSQLQLYDTQGPNLDTGEKWCTSNVFTNNFSNMDFNDGACFCNDDNVSILQLPMSVYLSDICPEISRPLDKMGNPFSENKIFAAQTFDQSEQWGFVNLNQWFQWEEIESEGCTVNQIEYQWLCSNGQATDMGTNPQVISNTACQGQKVKVSGSNLKPIFIETYKQDNDMRGALVRQDDYSSFIKFRLKMKTLSQKTRDLDIVVLVCGTQNITMSQLYKENSEEIGTSQRRERTLNLSMGIGSSDFPEQKQKYIVDLSKWFPVVETASYIDEYKLPDYVHHHCLIYFYTLCQDEDCLNTLTSEQIYLADHFDASEFTQYTQYFYSQIPQSLVVDIREPMESTRVFLRITNNGKFSFPIQSLKIQICGNEKISIQEFEREADSTIEILRIQDTVISRNLSDIFANSRPDCQITAYELSHNTSLRQQKLDAFIKLSDQYLKFDPEDLSAPDYPQFIKVSLTASTEARVSGVKDFILDLSFIHESYTILEFNDPPRISSTSEKPWQIDIDSKEIFEFSEVVSDSDQDQISFEWKNIEVLQNLGAVFQEFEQEELEKSFKVIVDSNGLTQYDIGSYEFSLIARDQESEVELVFSIEMLSSAIVESQKALTNETVTDDDQDEEVNKEQEQLSEIDIRVPTEQNEFNLFSETQLAEVDPKKNTRKAKKKAKRRVKKKPEPKIQFGRITPLGAIPLDFNQPLMRPQNTEEFDYSQVFDVSVAAGSDGSQVTGQFLTNKEARLLQERGEKPRVRNLQTINCEEEGCAATSKEFSWYISNHDETGMEIQTIFTNSDSVSTSTYGQDGVGLSVKRVDFFKSSDSGTVMNETGLPLSDCGDTGASMCKLMPPLMENEQQIENIETTSETLAASAEAVTFLSILVAILLGGVVQQLMGMVKIIQMLLIQACIAVVYPGSLTLLYTTLCSLGELDFLQGTTLYDAIFEFKETEPWSETFDQYEMGDKNLFMNTGSLMFLLFLMTLNFLFWILMHYLTKKYFVKKKLREIGIAGKDQGHMKTPLQLLLIDVYIDIILASSLNFFAIYQASDSENFWEFFSTPSNLMCSVFTIIFWTLGILAPIQITAVIKRNRHELQKPNILEKYGAYYDEFKNIGFCPYFNVILMVRRLFMVAILLGCCDFPCVQATLFLFTSLISLGVLVRLKPYKDPFTNKVEIFNEVTIFINSFLTILFMFNTDIDELSLLNSKKTIASFVILNVALNMVINMAIVAYQGLSEIFLAAKSYIQFYRDKKEVEMHEWARQILSQQDDQLKEIYEREVKIEEALEFCRDYARHREWCFQNDLDFRVLDDEAKYQLLVEEFGFRQRRDEIQREIELREQVYVLGLARQRIQPMINLNEKIQYFDKQKEDLRSFFDKTSTKEIHPKKIKASFRYNKEIQRRAKLWTEKDVEKIDEQEGESGSVRDKSVDEFEIGSKKSQRYSSQGNSSRDSGDWKQEFSQNQMQGSEVGATGVHEVQANKKPENLKTQMFRKVQLEKILSKQDFQSEIQELLVKLKDALDDVSIEGEEYPDPRGTPGELTVQGLDTTKMSIYQMLKSHMEKECGNLHNHPKELVKSFLEHDQDVIKAIEFEIKYATKQTERRKRQIEARMILLQEGYVWNDASQLATFQDETFDFIKEYDFSKFEVGVVEETMSHQSLVEGREHLPVVQGKKYLMNMVIESQNIGQFTKMTKMKEISKQEIDDWLQLCRYLGYTPIDYDMTQSQNPVFSTRTLQASIRTQIQRLQSIGQAEEIIDITLENVPMIKIDQEEKIRKERERRLREDRERRAYKLARLTRKSDVQAKYGFEFDEGEGQKEIKPSVYVPKSVIMKNERIKAIQSIVASQVAQKKEDGERERKASQADSSNPDLIKMSEKQRLAYRARALQTQIKDSKQPTQTEVEPTQTVVAPVQRKQTGKGKKKTKKKKIRRRTSTIDDKE